MPAGPPTVATNTRARAQTSRWTVRLAAACGGGHTATPGIRIYACRIGHHGLCQTGITEVLCRHHAAGREGISSSPGPEAVPPRERCGCGGNVPLRVAPTPATRVDDEASPSASRAKAEAVKGEMWRELCAPCSCAFGTCSRAAAALAMETEGLGSPCASPPGGSSGAFPIRTHMPGRAAPAISQASQFERKAIHSSDGSGRPAMAGSAPKDESYSVCIGRSLQRHRKIASQPPVLGAVCKMHGAASEQLDMVQSRQRDRKQN